MISMIAIYFVWMVIVVFGFGVLKFIENVFLPHWFIDLVGNWHNWNVELMFFFPQRVEVFRLFTLKKKEKYEVFFEKFLWKNSSKVTGRLNTS